MKTSIGVNHLQRMKKLQTLLEHYVAERDRLRAELGYATNQGAKADAEMFELLMSSYHIDARTTPVNLDLDGGFIITPDPEQAPPTEPESAKEAEPESTKATPVLKLAKGR